MLQKNWQFPYKFFLTFNVLIFTKQPGDWKKLPHRFGHEVEHVSYSGWYFSVFHCGLIHAGYKTMWGHTSTSLCHISPKAATNPWCQALPWDLCCAWTPLLLRLLALSAPLQTSQRIPKTRTGGGQRKGNKWEKGGLGKDRENWDGGGGGLKMLEKGENNQIKKWTGLEFREGESKVLKSGGGFAV